MELLGTWVQCVKLLGTRVLTKRNRVQCDVVLIVLVPVAPELGGTQGA